MSVSNTTATATVANNGNKKVIFEWSVPFTDCISEINIIQVDNAKGIDVVLSM